MGRKITVAVVALVALGFAAGTFYWLRARATGQPLPDVAAPEPPGFQEGMLTNPQPKPAPGKPGSGDHKKKAAPPRRVGREFRDV